MLGLPNFVCSVNWSQMTTSLQILSQVPRVDCYLQKCSGPDCVTCCVVNIFAAFKAGDIDDNVVNSLKHLYQLCHGSAVRAPFDYMTMLLAKFQHEAPQTQGTTYVKSPMVLFKGAQKYSDICLNLECSNNDDCEIPLYGIKLPLSQETKSVQDAINKYLEPSSKIECPVCSEDCLRTVTITHFPTMLLLSAASRPFDHPLSIPLELRVGYVGYSFHSAVLSDGQHNIVVCKVSNYLLEVNDTQVKRISFAMLQNEVYCKLVSCIVYQKQTPSTPSTPKSKTKPRVTSTSKKWNVESMTGGPMDIFHSPVKEDNAEADSSQTLQNDRKTGHGRASQDQHAVTFVNGVKIVYIRCIASFELFQKNMTDEEFRFFTGLTKCNFNALFELNGGEEGILNLKLSYTRSTPQRKRRKMGTTTATTVPTKDVTPFTTISAKSRLLLLLLRMRRGVPLYDLGYAFGISKSYAASIFFAVLRKVCNTFRSMEKLMFLTKEQQQKKRPAVFKKFPAVRLIIDGAEFKTYTPSNYEQQGNTWSLYKKSNTVKYLIGISCYGGVVFVSQGFEGSKSDKEIFNASGLGNWLEEGDAVMCDRGFDIVGELLSIGVTTVKPPYLGKRKCLTPSEQAYTAAVAKARIYVEHAIGKIKENRLLRFTIPLNMIGTFDDLVYVAAYLTNFSNRAIKQKPSNRR